MSSRLITTIILTICFCMNVVGQDNILRIERTALVSNQKHGFTKGDPKELIEVTFDKSGLITKIENKTKIAGVVYNKVSLKRTDSFLCVEIQNGYDENKLGYLNISITDQSLEYNYSINDKLVKNGVFEKNKNTIFSNGYLLIDKNYMFTSVSELMAITTIFDDGFTYLVYKGDIENMYYKGFDNFRNTYNIAKGNLYVVEEYNGEDWSTIYPDVVIKNYKVRSSNMLINICNYIVLEYFNSDIARLLVPSLFVIVNADLNLPVFADEKLPVSRP